MKQTTFRVAGLAVLTSVVLIVALAYVFKSNLTNNTLSTGTQKVQIVTSFYPLYFLASQITGSAADVRTIVPAGIEPHDYELSPRDVARIENSDLVVLNGSHLEPWGEDITDSLKNTNTMVISVGDAFANRTVEEDGEMATDPHVWLDPVLAKSMAANIANALIAIDSEHQAVYVENLATLQSQLDALHTTFLTGLASCNKKDFITSHEAFGYLAARYGLNQVGIAGISPEEEPTAQALARVAEFAKKNNVHYIFFEELASPDFAETVATEVGAQTLVLNPIEGLTDEELSEGRTYSTEMEKNLANLRIALECQ